LGAMRANVPGLAHEIGWTPARLGRAMKEGTGNGMIAHDADSSCVALPNFLKHNRPESPNVVKAWTKCLDDIPDCAIKTDVISRAKSLADSLSKGFSKALGEDFRKSMPYQEQEQEQEQEQDNTDASGAAPSLESSSMSFRLVDSILKWKGDHKLSRMADAQIREWANRQAIHFDHLNRLDDVSWDRMSAVLCWLPTNDFWPPNVQTGAKFRAQFDRLESEMRKRAGGAKERAAKFKLLEPMPLPERDNA